MHHRRKEPATPIDYLYKNLLLRLSSDIKNSLKFRKSRKNFKESKKKQAVGFEGSQESMLRKLKSIGLKYRWCKNRIFLLL